MKEIVEKVNQLFKLKVDKDQRILLIISSIVGLVGAYTGPTMVKEIMSALSANMIALQSIISIVSILLINLIWQKKLKMKALRAFTFFCAAESICGCALGLYLAFVEYNPLVFAWASCIYTNLITTFVCKVIDRSKNTLWIEGDRDNYNRNSELVSGLISLAALVVAVFVAPTPQQAMALWGFSCLVDNIGWIIVIRRHKSRILTSIEAED